MKNSTEHINNRHQNILNILQAENTLSTNDLALQLEVSISTLRRDLNVLEEKNFISRRHGYCSYNFDNADCFDKTGPELLKKNISKVASTFIHDYHTVFINSSSTALSTVNYLTTSNLTIITNNLKIASYPNDNHNTYLLTGGEIRFPKEVLVGDITADMISKVNADICIIGCNGVSLDEGVTTNLIHEAKINELMIKRTFKHKILVADYRKIGHTSKFKISEISAFDYLITDKYCPKNLKNSIEKLGVKVIIAS